MSVCVRVLLHESQTKTSHLVPWTSVSISNYERLSYAALFDIISHNENLIDQNNELSHGTASSSFALSEEVRGNADIDVVDIVRTFKFRFLSLHVVKRVELASTSTPNSDTRIAAAPNAFSVLMQGAVDVAGQENGVKMLPGKDNYEKLHNTVLDFMTEKECIFNTDGDSGRRVHESNRKFMSCVTNLLWYMDSQYHKIEERVTLISRVPKIFMTTRFSGYNLPEKSKHRKRTLSNLSETKIEKLCIELREAMANLPSTATTTSWLTMKELFGDLASSLEEYSLYLRKQAKLVVKSQNTVRESEAEKKLNVKILRLRNHLVTKSLRSLNDKLSAASEFDPICVRDYLPTGLDRRQMHRIIQELLDSGLSRSFVYYAAKTGGPKPDLHFIARLEDATEENVVFNKSYELVRKVERDLPIYEKRITKREFKMRYGFLASSVALRSIFKDLTNDQSAACSLSESEIDARMKFALESEDTGIVVDLRTLPADRKSDKFSVFYEETNTYLTEEVGVSVQERRHTDQLYIAKAVSFRDLHQIVEGRVPEGTAIPSLKWFRYQFNPVNEHANSSKYYKSNIKIKMMVQKRQVRVDHIDSHYCAAQWRYARMFCILHKDLVVLVSMDDKHKIKVGEPGYPLAAVERGKKVIVGANQVMAVGDHDFSKCTLTPSVNLVIDIPDKIEASFHRGQVHIGFKDSVLEPSSAMRHSAELSEILERGEVKPGLVLYTDGGPDHRVNYLSVKIALIAMFRALDLDFLIALRTAPSNSWANPVERIMSVVNIGLQGVGLMRTKGTDAFEKAISSANSVKVMRNKLDSDDLRKELQESLLPVCDLLRGQMCRLSLKGQRFKLFDAADEVQLSRLWREINKIEPSFDPSSDKPIQKDLKKMPGLKRFLEHTCTEGHYLFAIYKCGTADCEICGPIRDERSRDVKKLPFPVLRGDHYAPFEEVYGSETTDTRPSASCRPRNARTKLDFSPSIQHAKNTKLRAVCIECGKPRLVFSKKKLSAKKLKELESILNDVDYSCGTMSSDFETDIPFMIKDHDCTDNVEKLYYSSDLFEPVCMVCGSDTVGNVLNGYYPSCTECEPVRR